MHHRAKRLKHQSQTIRHAVATDVSLIKLDLMKHRLDGLIINAFCSDF